MSDQPVEGATLRKQGQAGSAPLARLGSDRAARLGRRRCSLRRLILGLAVGCAGGPPVPALAQYVSGYFPAGVPGYDQELGVTVVSRLHPLYEQPGIRVGSFTLQPDLTESTGYNSNIPGIAGGPGSPVIETHPTLSVNSDWGRNALGANLNVDDLRYPATPSQNRTDWTAAVGGAYTIDRNDLTLGYAHLALHESATDIGAPLSATPIPYTVDDLRAAYRIDFGRLEITPNLDVSLQRYGNAVIGGAILSQGFRNANEFGAGAAFRYALSEQRALIFTVQGLQSDFTNQAPGAASLSSTSVLALGGLDYQYDGVWRYQALAGVEIRSFAAAQFETDVAPIARVTVIWTPTELTTVTGTALRAIENPTQPGTSGYAYTSAELRVDHEYLRNVLLSARTGIEHVAYLQNGETQTGYYIGTGVTWLLNRHLRLAAEYIYTQHTSLSGSSAGSSGPGAIATNPGYTQNVFLLTLRLSL